MEVTDKKQAAEQQEMLLAEKWVTEKYGKLTQEELLKLLVYKLHKLEEQSRRINNIL